MLGDARKMLVNFKNAISMQNTISKQFILCLGGIWVSRKASLKATCRMQFFIGDPWAFSRFQIFLQVGLLSLGFQYDLQVGFLRGFRSYWQDKLFGIRVLHGDLIFALYEQPRVFASKLQRVTCSNAQKQYKKTAYFPKFRHEHARGCPWMLVKCS